MRRPIIILLILLVIGGVVWFLLSKTPTTESGESGGGVFQNFFSRNTDSPQGTDGAVAGDPSLEIPELAPTSSFTLITSSPIAGYIAFNKTRTVTIPAEDPKQKPIVQTITEHFIRYVARSNGYVYEVKEGGSTTQISNTYVPNVYEAVFTPDAKTVIVRFLREDGRSIASYSIPIPDQNLDGTRTQQAGIYFPESIQALALSPDGKSVLYVSPSETGTAITTSDVKSAGKKELLQSPFTGWLPSWSISSIYLQTKATTYAPGFFYKLDTTGKRLVKIIGDIPGLTVSLSPKSDYLFYSESSQDNFMTKILSMKSRETKTLGVPLLPEKCTWLVNQNLICAGGTTMPAPYPDAWYAGTVSFADKLYLVYIPGGAYDILDAGEEWVYDATLLQADEKNRFLYFIDKPTGLLWQFEY